MYLLSAARARQVVETHCGPEEKLLVRPGKSCIGQGETAEEEEVTGTTGDGEMNSKKIQQLLDLVLTCKRNAENEVKREERLDGLKTLGRKRKLEQRAAARAIKFLKAAHGPAGHHKIPVEDRLSTTPYSLQSVIGSLGLREGDLRERGSEPAVKLLHLLTGLSQDASRLTSKEEDQRESCPFGRLATKLGLPANCDIDLRKQEELEEQTADSVSSLEGFSPGSHSGEMNLHRAAGGREKKGAGEYEEDEEEWEIPWVLIPITGTAKDKQEEPQEKDTVDTEPSFLKSVQSSVIHAAQKKPSSLSTLSVQDKPYPQREKINANKNQQVMNKQKETAAVGHKTGKDKEVHFRAEVTNKEETKGEEGKHVAGSTYSQSAQPHRDIDSIVDRNIDNFFSEMQLLLQEESIPCSFSQTPHTASHAEASIPQHTLSPHCLTTSFSHYISVHHDCPTVQDYVSSLKDGIKSMMTDFGGNVTHDPAHTEADTVLASRVSAYVSSIRAANINTERCDDSSAPGTSAPSTGGQMWRSDLMKNQQPDVNSRQSPTDLTVTVPTFLSDKPRDIHHLRPPSGNFPSRTLELSGTFAQNVRQTAGNIFIKTLDCTVPHTEVPVSSFVPKTSAEPSDPDSVSASEAMAPQPTKLNSLINTLEPEVFSSLIKIIKDVKKNSLQFYIHSTEPVDQVFVDVKQYLLKQGNVEQTPVAFLNQEKSNSRLMVIIKNKDIAEHIHRIPNLVSLKRRSSVLFVGIDSLDDIKNNSYNEIFVSGGCIISDELIFDPDVVSEGQLAELLKLLEQQNSLESVWKWKIHCKTHKKLKELARIRKEAANVLELLSVYQKQQIVEFLPYHHCDMADHQSPDLDCVIELQARYTQYRHTIFLTERCLNNSPNYISGGIIVAGVEETLHNFSRLVGYHNIKDRQPVLDTLLTSKGLDSQLSPSDPGLGSECSPSIFPEHKHLLASVEKHQHLFLQPGFGFLSQPHPSDQLVPDASCKDVMPQPSDTDFEVLSLAISQLRAERQARLQQQQQQLDSKLELKMDFPQSPTTNPVSRGSSHSNTPPQSRGVPTKSAQGTRSRKAVAATLDFIHSALQEELQEKEEEEVRVKSTEGQQREKKSTDGRGDSGDGPLVRGTLSEENQSPSQCNTSTSSFSKNKTAVTTTRDRNLTNAETIKTVQVQDLCPSAATCSTVSCPTGVDKARDTRSEQEQPKREAQAQSGPVENVSGSATAPTSQDDKPIPVISQSQWSHKTQQNLQAKQWQSYPQHHQPLLHRRQQEQQWSSSYIPPHLLSHYSGQPLAVAPMLRPLTALGRTRGHVGPTPVWAGGLRSAGATNLTWGFPQTVSGMYHNPTAQGSNVYRGGQRGGFNGM
ncbi:uncharacterized protein tasora isoform X2 [Cynoglossus semilaevis]|nr:protein TASOR isoform X2 [Cynoglossus semilaevis]